VKVYLIIALRNLLQARRRTLLVGTALAMVTTLLVMLLALSRGLTETMISSATTLQTGHVNVAGWFKSKASDGQPVVSESPALRRLVEENTPGLAYVIDRQRGWARLVSDTASLQVGLSGIEVREEARFFERVQLASGDAKGLAEEGTILIFETQAKQLAVEVGDTLTLTSETFSGARNTADVTVVAIAKDVGLMSNWNAYLPKKTVQDLSQLREDTTGAIMVYLEDVEDASRVLDHLRGVIERAGYPVMEHDPQRRRRLGRTADRPDDLAGRGVVFDLGVDRGRQRFGDVDCDLAGDHRHRDHE
jgi:putative ABC transport system permease protein